MILDLDGFNPGLAFDLFTVQRSPFLSDKTSDPNFKAVFKGSFGLAWYQSDIEIGKRSDNGHVRIKTILLDQIFGFHPDAALRTGGSDSEFTRSSTRSGRARRISAFRCCGAIAVSDASICIDAINHFSDRPRVVAEWARLLKVGGRLLFTDPIT